MQYFRWVQNSPWIVNLSKKVDAGNIWSLSRVVCLSRPRVFHAKQLNRHECGLRIAIALTSDIIQQLLSPQIIRQVFTGISLVSILDMSKAEKQRRRPFSLTDSL